MKYGWNEILFKFLFRLIGLLDFVWCKNIKWIIVNVVIIKGRRKWKDKNCVRVVLFIVNFF